MAHTGIWMSVCGLRQAYENDDKYVGESRQSLEGTDMIGRNGFQGTRLLRTSLTGNGRILLKDRDQWT